MASVLPSHRPNTNSTSTSGSATSRNRHPSLSSFPSSKRSVTSSQDDTLHLSPQHTHTHSFNSQVSSARSSHSQQLSQARNHGAPHRLLPRSPLGKTRKVKSQYPRDGEKHVEYILIASFDIDRGSIMEHQYPGPVGGDDQMLAELMLPDGAHVRAQDWTIFFLHKDAAAEEESDGTSKGRRRRRRNQYGQAGAGAERSSLDELEDEDYFADATEDDDSDDDMPHNLDGPPLVYVLNLVNTKQDNTVKRGAIVKAMAICTRHPFLHIYKPLLLLALQQYFANPAIETLAALYDSVNAMDLSLMPRLSPYEQFILQSSDAKDLFLEKFEALIAQNMTKSPQKQTHQHTSSPSAPPVRGRFGLPRDTHEFESVVNYANIPVPIKVPVALSLETVGDFSLIKLITTFSTPHTTAPVAFQPTHPHLTTGGPLTHPIIVLMNALLTQKRVIFLGHNLPSGDVAEAVLGACALASGGLLRGFTRHAFPYTDLTKIDDLLNVPGFIAGVTNPAFAHKAEWWDLLCDISTGRMKISAKVEQAPLTEGVAYFQNPSNGFGANGNGGIGALVGAGASLSAGLGGNISSQPVGDVTGDQAFMSNVLQAINERHGENAIRSKFRRWVLKFTRLSAAFEETVYGATSLQVRPAPPPPPTTPGMVPSPGLGILASSPRTPGKKMPLTPTGPSPSDPIHSPEVAGHGYVWPTPAQRHVELAANAARIEGWRMTRSYYNFIQDLAVFYSVRPVKELDLQHLHDRLAKLRLTPEQSGAIYLAISAAVNTNAEINQLLSVICSGTPVPAGGVGGGHIGSAGSSALSNTFQGQHGLFYLALGLFHPKAEVRENVAGLLGRIQEHEAGRHFWGGLGRFARMAWERVVAGRGGEGEHGEEA